MNHNDYVSVVSNLSVLMPKFDVMIFSNFHKVLKNLAVFSSKIRLFEYSYSIFFNFSVLNSESFQNERFLA